MGTLTNLSPGYGKFVELLIQSNIPDKRQEVLLFGARILADSSNKWRCAELLRVGI